jgi:transcription-repair coupling factor (superfamily II helicase)
MAKIARIDAGPAAIALTPRPDFAGPAKEASLTPKGERLLLQERIESNEDRLLRVRELLEALADD